MMLSLRNRVLLWLVTALCALALPGRTLAAEQQQRTLKQAVVVGIGGAGTEIAARLKHSRDRFYGKLGELREMIQIVAFDTLDFNLQSELVQEALRLNEDYIHLGNFHGRDLINAHRNNPDLQRWWDHGYLVGAVPIRSGCNRIRQLGRLCLWRWRADVTAALTQAIDRARALDDRLEDWRPGNRIYLVDNTVGGLVLRNLEDLFTLAADALSHLLITPLGVNEDGQEANLIDNLVIQEHQGRIKGFSSAGVSYVLFPARTVTRCALAGYLRDVVYQRLTRDLTDADRAAAKQQAKVLFEQHRSRLDPATVTAALLQSPLMSLPSVAPSRRWIDEQEKALHGNWESIRDEGDRLLNGWQAQTVTALTETYNQQHAAWLADVETLTVEQSTTASGRTASASPSRCCANCGGRSTTPTCRTARSTRTRRARPPPLRGTP